MSLDTRSTLIDVATGQVRRQGYSAFSYADLADAVGIRKPSIHHHFPTKEDLGAAIVAAYTERFSEQLGRIDAETGEVVERVRAYARLYREGLDAGQGCLCGVLASEVAVLPTRGQNCPRNPPGRDVCRSCPSRTGLVRSSRGGPSLGS
jgi:TetR/AcrR family transcriptional regulator, transcriptional repressor for nem operon